MQGKAQEFVKAFTDKMSEVGESIKTTNPDLFSGDTTKAKVSIKQIFVWFFFLFWKIEMNGSVFLLISSPNL